MIESKRDDIKIQSYDKKKLPAKRDRTTEEEKERKRDKTERQRYTVGREKQRERYHIHTVIVQIMGR